MELWKGRDKSQTAAIVVMLIFVTYNVREQLVISAFRINGLFLRFTEEDSYFSKDEEHLIWDLNNCFPGIEDVREVIISLIDSLPSVKLEENYCKIRVKLEES